MRKFFNKIATKIKSSKKLMVGATVASVVAISAVPAFAEDAVTDPTIASMQTAFTGVKDQGISAIAVIAPIAIVILGAFLVWKWGSGFFKKLAK